MSDQGWNAEDAWAETYLTVRDLMEKNGDLKALAGQPVSLDLQFVPEADGSADKFIRALRMFGYEAREYPDDPSVEVTVVDVPFTAEAIWEQEERTAKIALAQKYRPDGWGFAEP